MKGHTLQFLASLSLMVTLMLVAVGVRLMIDALTFTQSNSTAHWMLISISIMSLLTSGAVGVASVVQHLCHRERLRMIDFNEDDAS